MLLLMYDFYGDFFYQAILFTLETWKLRKATFIVIDLILFYGVRMNKHP